MNRIAKRSLALVIVLLAAAATLSASGTREDNGPMVVATTSIIGDVVSEVSGGLIDVKTIIPKGQNPHSFQPVPSDMKYIENADIIFINGFELEEGMLTVIRNTARGRIVEVSRDVVPIHAEEKHESEDESAAEDHDHHTDPHTWTSPENVILWTRTISAECSAEYPDLADGIARNAAAYEGKLNDLDAYIKNKVSAIPVSKRKLVSDHLSFSYFARTYGFEVTGAVIPGFSTNTEASARAIADLAQKLKTENVSTVFTGMETSPSVLELFNSLSEASGMEIKVVDLLMGSLAEDGKDGDNYLGFMKYNADRITGSLSE